jgi:hypothetical protein
MTIMYVSMYVFMYVLYIPSVILDNKQWIWASPLTELSIVGCVYIITEP